MERWEYSIVYLSFVWSKNPEYEKDQLLIQELDGEKTVKRDTGFLSMGRTIHPPLSDFLNDMGNLGWRLVSKDRAKEYNPSTSYDWVFIFERPVAND